MVPNGAPGQEEESVIQPSASTAPSNDYQQIGHNLHDPDTEPRSYRAPAVECRGRTVVCALSCQNPPTARSGEPDDSTANTYPPPGPHPQQRTQTTDSTPPRRTAQQPPESHHSRSPAATTSPPLTHTSPPQLLHPLILGSQMTIFIIDQLNANFSSTITNHDSENVTTTTLTDVANDSSYRSA